MATIEEAFTEAHTGHARDADGEWTGKNCPLCRDNRALALTAFKMGAKAGVHDMGAVVVGDKADEIDRQAARIEALGAEGE